VGYRITDERIRGYSGNARQIGGLSKKHLTIYGEVLFSYAEQEYSKLYGVVHYIDD